jgi:putative aldouronate transport system substrate-binding protein
MKKQKSTAVLLALSLTAALFAGCNGSKNQGDQSKTSPTGNAQTVSPTKQVGYPEKLTYYVTLDGNTAATMKSYSEVAVYKKLEEITKTKVEFQHPASDPKMAREQFNLLMTSGKLPDVIEWDWRSVSRGPDAYIQDKRIIRLNELIDQYAPNLSKLLKEKPELRKMITTDGGNIYCFPFLRGDDYLLTFNGPIFRQDWLDKVNMKVPTTIDEWEKVLKAFKANDLNGNGKADEIPFLLDLNMLWVNHLFLGSWGITNWYYQENGKVMFGPVQPQFKEYLTLMNRWYNEGLIDKDYATTNDKLKDAKVTGNQLGAFVGNTGGGIGKYMGLMKGKDPTFKLVAAPYPVLKAGDRPILGQKDVLFNGFGAAITTDNKHPEETVKWLDYAYSPEGHMLFNFGTEGESYKMENGYPKYTDLIMKNPQGLSVAQAMSRYIRGNSSGPFVQDKRYMEQYAQLPEQKQSIDIWMNAENKKQMPLINLNADETNKLSSINNDIKTLLEEKMARFIMGAESLDKFDDFVKTIKGMGLDEAIKIQQAALERYNSRK